MEIISGNEMSGIDATTDYCNCSWTCKCPTGGLYNTYYANQDAAHNAHYA